MPKTKEKVRCDPCCNRDICDRSQARGADFVGSRTQDYHKRQLWQMLGKNMSQDVAAKSVKKD